MSDTTSPERTCSQGCNGCDDCTDYEDGARAEVAPTSPASGALPADPRPHFEKWHASPNGRGGYAERGFYAGWNAHAALASREASPAPLTEADVKRRTAIAFEATIESDHKSLLQYWYAKGLREGAALASPQVAPVCEKCQGTGVQKLSLGGFMAHGSCDSCAAPAPVAPTPAQPSEDARDAARYRFLRRQYWDRASLFVVSGGKESVRLGTYCPTVDRLDDLIDAALSAPKGEAATPSSQGGRGS